MADDRKLVMVVNDNGRSYQPTVGGLATHLASLRTNPRYEEMLDLVKKRLNKVKGVGPAVYDALHAMKKGMLVMFGARERTQEEYDALLTGAGFTPSRLLAAEAEWNVLEARPAG